LICPNCDSLMVRDTYIFCSGSGAEDAIVESVELGWGCPMCLEVFSLEQMEGDDEADSGNV
jgi:hypothetical protein